MLTNNAKGILKNLIRGMRMAEWTMSPHPPPPPFLNAPPPLKVYVFLIKKGLLPNVFKEMFFMTNQVHSYNTRNSNTFYLFPAQTNIRLFGITFQGPKIFSRLNNNIQGAATISLLS